MARALCHDTDHAQALNCAFLFEGVDDLLRTIPKIHTPTIRRFLIREISIREGDRKLTACNQGKNEINDLRFFVRYLLSRVVDNTRRTLIESTINLVKLILLHIGKLVAKGVPTIRVLHIILIQTEDRVEFVSGEIVALHGNTFQVVGGLPLRSCPLPSRILRCGGRTLFVLPHQLYYAPCAILYSPFLLSTRFLHIWILCFFYEF